MSALARAPAPRAIGASVRPATRPSRVARQPVTMMAANIQFIPGINEPCVPDVKLTRSRDGGQGVAKFRFDQPSVFEAGNELGEITGLYMIDDEGTITSIDVNAKFVNGKPDSIECVHVMKSAYDWDRFMRFMDRYAEENGLGFKGK